MRASLSQLLAFFEAQFLSLALPSTIPPSPAVTSSGAATTDAVAEPTVPVVKLLPTLTMMQNAVLPEEVSSMPHEYLRCIYALPRLDDYTRQIFGLF
jgi:hypothetical protein